MNRISKYISGVLMSAIIGCSFTACDDWTEPEHVDLGYGTIDKAEPESYIKYLENLRAYRNKEHKLVYAWFNNSTDAFGSQGHRISALPDSIDVVILQNPAGVTNQIQNEMYDARVNKGMQFGYCISYTDIYNDWVLDCEDKAAKRLEWTKVNGKDKPIPAELEDRDFSEFMAEAWTAQLKYFNQIGFDCLMAAFDGKATNHLTAAELAEYLEKANLFLGILSDWHARNPEVAIDYVGKPQYITDNAILPVFRQVFLSESLNATNINMYTQALDMADGAVAESKIGMIAAVRALDTNADPKTGIFSNGTYAVDALAEWTAAHSVGAAGIMNVQNDYFISNGHYTAVRAFIQTINPAAK